MREGYTASSRPPKEDYHVHQADGTFVAVDSLERLYEFHNSGKKQIVRLDVQFIPPPAEAVDSADVGTRIEFSGDQGSERVLITVKDPNPKWAAETFATVEEQVERTFQKGFMYEVSYQRLALGAALLCASIVLTVLIFWGPQKGRATTMWLTKAEVAQIATDLEKSSTISQEQQLAILQRQLSNVRQSLENPRPTLTWPMALVFVPVLIVMLAFMYLFKRCYPRAVFVWGDAEEGYQNLVRQRTFVWNTIIISTGVGILAGLFVLGIDLSFR